MPALGSVVMCALRSVSAGQDSDKHFSGVYQLSIELLDGGGRFQCIHWRFSLWLVWLVKVSLDALGLTWGVF